MDTSLKLLGRVDFGPLLAFSQLLLCTSQCVCPGVRPWLCVCVCVCVCVCPSGFAFGCVYISFYQ